MVENSDRILTIITTLATCLTTRSNREGEKWTIRDETSRVFRVIDEKTYHNKFASFPSTQYFECM